MERECKNAHWRAYMTAESVSGHFVGGRYVIGVPRQQPASGGAYGSSPFLSSPQRDGRSGSRVWVQYEMSLELDVSWTGSCVSRKGQRPEEGGINLCMNTEQSHETLGNEDMLLHPRCPRPSPGGHATASTTTAAASLGCACAMVPDNSCVDSTPYKPGGGQDATTQAAGWRAVTRLDDCDNQHRPP